MIAIRIAAYAMSVELESSDTFPDALHDLTNRALEAFGKSLELMKSNEIVVFDPDFDPEDR
jgi:hypothetical protein